MRHLAIMNLMTLFFCSLNSYATSSTPCLDMATRLAYAVEGEHGNLNMGMTHDLKQVPGKLSGQTEYSFGFKVGGGLIETVKVVVYYSSEQKKCYLSSVSLQ